MEEKWAFAKNLAQQKFLLKVLFVYTMKVCKNAVIFRGNAIYVR